MSSYSKSGPGQLSPEEKELSDLLHEISRGNEKSMDELYDRTSPFVYGLITKILSDHQEAEEVVTDVYMQIWNNASSYDPCLSKPLTWILMLARSRSIDRIRSGAKRKKRTRELSEEMTSGGRNNPEESSIASQKREIVNRALAQLSNNQREAIELAYFYGMSQTEIAGEMNQPLGTVKSWIRLGMKKLRENLSGE